MVLLDDDRLRYPNEYFTINGKISNLRINGGFVDFTLTENGFTIECRGSTDLMKGIKEGQITEGKIECTVGFKLPGKNLSEAKPYLRVEGWENVKIE